MNKNVECGKITTASGHIITRSVKFKFSLQRHIRGSYHKMHASPIYVCPLTKAELHSLDFAATRFPMTSSTAVIKDCGRYFGFQLPSELLEKRFTKFMSKRNMSWYSSFWPRGWHTVHLALLQLFLACFPACLRLYMHLPMCWWINIIIKLANAKK